MSKVFVAILMGSDSDLPVLQASADTLKSLGIRYEMRVHSAHRTPDETQAYVKDADQRGCAVFIAAAGMAAHLAGTIAALTLKPVIGVPLAGGILDGLDSLLSTVQMPGGVPVATVAVGKAGARNAAYLAAQILALSDPALAQKIRTERDTNRAQVLAKDAALQAQLKGG
ncbi:MAG: 5-(carboxyamino)imidazole ribonucleotide mutase [Nevskiales bacterium]